MTKKEISQSPWIPPPSFLSPISNRLCNLMLWPICLCCQLLSTLQSLLTRTFFFISWLTTLIPIPLLERNWFFYSISLILSFPSLKNVHNGPITYNIHSKLLRKGLYELVSIWFSRILSHSFFLHLFYSSVKVNPSISSLGS